MVSESESHKLSSKLKEARTKANIRKVFVFDENWKRTQYQCCEGTNQDIQLYYENNTLYSLIRNIYSKKCNIYNNNYINTVIEFKLKLVKNR